MPLRYVCGVCGKDITKEEYNNTTSVIIEHEGQMEVDTLLEDVCASCEKVVRDAIMKLKTKE